VRINCTITRNVYFGYYTICIHTKFVDKDMTFFEPILYLSIHPSIIMVMLVVVPLNLYRNGQWRLIPSYLSFIDVTTVAGWYGYHGDIFVRSISIKVRITLVSSTHCRSLMSVSVKQFHILMAAVLMC